MEELNIEDTGANWEKAYKKGKSSAYVDGWNDSCANKELMDPECLPKRMKEMHVDIHSASNKAMQDYKNGFAAHHGRMERKRHAMKQAYAPYKEGWEKWHADKKELISQYMKGFAGYKPFKARVAHWSWRRMINSTTNKFKEGLLDAKNGIDWQPKYKEYSDKVRTEKIHLNEFEDQIVQEEDTDLQNYVQGYRAYNPDILTDGKTRAEPFYSKFEFEDVDHLQSSGRARRESMIGGFAAGVVGDAFGSCTDGSVIDWKYSTAAKAGYYGAAESGKAVYEVGADIAKPLTG